LVRLILGKRARPPTNDKVQLDTVQRAAVAAGRKLKLELV
jgi:hypothetical protein